MEENFKIQVQALSEGSLWVLLGSVSSKIFFIVSQILIARVLGASEYGLISIGIINLFFFSILGKLGLDTGVRRFLPEYKKQKDRESIVAFGSSLISISSLLIGLTIFYFSDYISVFLFDLPRLAPVLKVFSLSIPFYSLAVFFLRSLEGLLIMKYRLWVEGLIFGVVLVASVSIAVTTANVTVVSISYLVSYVVMLVASYSVLRKRIKLRFKNTFKNFSRRGKKLVKYSWPLSFHPSLEMLIKHSNVILLGILMTDFEVGLYSAAVNIAVLLGWALSIATPTFFPLVNNLHAESRDSSRIYMTLTTWIILLTTPVIITGIIFGNEIMFYFFGQQFSSAGSILSILLVGTFFSIIPGPIEMYLNSFDYTKLVMYNMIAATFVALIGGIFLIPLLGLTGAAVVYVSAVFVQKILGLFELKLKENILPFKKNIWRTILLALSFGVLLVLLKLAFNNIIILSFLIFCCFLLYSLAALKLVLDDEDFVALNFVKNMVKRYIISV